MKIKDITEAMVMPLGKISTVTPGSTDPAKAVVNIKTADGKDIQTTADQLVQGPNNTFQLKTAEINQTGTGLKPGATVTQAPSQATGSTVTNSTSSTKIGEEPQVEEDGNQEFDPTWVDGKDEVPGTVSYLQPGQKGLSPKDPGVQTLYPAQMSPELRRKYQIASFQRNNPGVPLPVELGGPGMSNNESAELNHIRKLSGI